MKQELEKKSKEVKQIRHDASQKQTKINELRQQVTMLTQNNRALQQDSDRLSKDLQHNEEEVEILRMKISSLQDAITSPSGDPRCSALNRFITENPPPQDISFQSKLPNENNEILTKKTKDIANPADILSPFELKTKQCGIVGLTKTKSIADSNHPLNRSPCKDKSNIRRIDSSPSCTVTSSQPNMNASKPSLSQSLFKRTKMEDLKSPSPIAPSYMFYNGFGGHSKLDSFPVATKKDFKLKSTPFNKSKKPKGVSRPKTSKQTNSKVDSERNIEDFFSTLNS